MPIERLAKAAQQLHRDRVLTISVIELRAVYNISMFRPFLIFAILLVGSLALADAAKRLILKDGTYQTVTQYELKGDRVRYLSAERYEWEEMPKDLIDWPATQKWEEDSKKAVSHTAEQIDKEVEDEKKLEDARTPEVAPSLRLPMGGGVFVLDNYRNTPQLVELYQNNSDLSKDYKGDFIRRTINPFASSKQKIELDGPHAKTQIHVPRPVLFFNVDEQKKTDDSKGPTSGNPDKIEDAMLMPPKMTERYRIVRAQSGKNSRVIGNLKISIAGKVSQQQTFVPATGEMIGGGWVKITPQQDLVPGEYAVAEMMGDKEMNLFVWDFGVNPAAPENAGAWKPENDIKEPAPQSPPTLDKRPKKY